MLVCSRYQPPPLGPPHKAGRGTLSAGRHASQTRLQIGPKQPLPVQFLTVEKASGTGALFWNVPGLFLILRFRKC